MSATQYAIQRTADRFWWAGGNRWTASRAGAKTFDSWTVAELTGLRDLPDDVKTWSVQPVEQAA